MCGADGYLDVCGHIYSINCACTRKWKASCHVGSQLSRIDGDCQFSFLELLRLRLHAHDDERCGVSALVTLYTCAFSTA